jgi:membrane protease YdiL (CAAX protease family)
MAQGACREVQMYTVVMSEGNPETGNSAAAEKPDDRISKESFLADIVTGIGAGIYEELIFRLILMCILMVLLQDIIGMTHANAIVLSVLISAALFSAHHHVVFVNGRLTSASAFNWTEFSFRTMAGVYFAVLFAIRGFGITAGTHAFYDIIATVINIAFFQH